MHPDRCKHSRKVNGKEASVNMRDDILKQIEQRQDKCGKDVCACLAGAYDLVAEEAVYHSTCRVKFYDSESISSNKGRPVNTFIKCVFAQTCEWLEKYLLMEKRFLEQSGSRKSFKRSIVIMFSLLRLLAEKT